MVVDAPSPPSTPSNSICLHTGTGCLSPIIAWWRSCSEARSVTRNYRHLLPWPEERWQWRRRSRRRWRTAPLNNAPRTMRHLRKSDFFSMATQDRVEVQRVCLWNPDLSSHEQSENRERGEERRGARASTHPVCAVCPWHTGDKCMARGYLIRKGHSRRPLLAHTLSRPLPPCPPLLEAFF